MDSVQIITPPVASTDVDEVLVMLTEAIAHRDPDSVAHGFLGGEFGYGARYENDVFVMRPFYWGDCDCGADDRESQWSAAHAHSDDCYQSDLRRAKIAKGWRVMDGGYLSAPSEVAPYDVIRRIEREIYADLCAKHGGLDPNRGAAVHCTCGHDNEYAEWAKDHGHTPTCSLEMPNFRHKASGLEARWYKWIGRGMEFSGDGDWHAAILEAIESVQKERNPSTADTPPIA